ncbi:MAG TPA: hypothetical protein PLX15_02750 [Candidatus Woesearchaeota archaeon]|nr:hypothetical protein [Candidatus Woesearchaeota archaeon]
MYNNGNDNNYNGEVPGKKPEDNDITGRLTPTKTGRFECGSDENAFYVGGTKFSKPPERDYQDNVITKEQAKENRLYRIFDRTRVFCVGAMALTIALLGITGIKNVYDFYTTEKQNLTLQQFESHNKPEFVTPKYILDKQEEQIENIIKSQKLLEEGNTQGTTIENIIE